MLLSLQKQISAVIAPPLSIQYDKPGWSFRYTQPIRLMEKVGLDVVLDIEEHYAAANGHSEGPRRLLRTYVQEGRLGQKTGRGFFDDY